MVRGLCFVVFYSSFSQGMTQEGPRVVAYKWTFLHQPINLPEGGFQAKM